ncbi:MAG: hypothetical protein ABW169_12425, partial [Sphingobium sp.]
MRFLERVVQRQTAGAAFVVACGFFAASSAKAETKCSDVSIPVSLSAKLSKDQKIFGRLCRPLGANPSTLQILIHGSSYDH